jgi:hypothetical protein
MGRAVDFISEVRGLGGCVSCEKLHFGRKRTFSSMSTTPLQGVACAETGVRVPRRPARGARSGALGAAAPVGAAPPRPFAQGADFPHSGFVPSCLRPPPPCLSVALPGKARSVRKLALLPFLPPDLPKSMAPSAKIPAAAPGTLRNRPRADQRGYRERRLGHRPLSRRLPRMGPFRIPCPAPLPSTFNR